MFKRLACCAVSVLLACSFAQAGPVLFTFSFDNDNGNVPGTVSGTIHGLVDNQNGQSASSIVLTSYPIGLVGTPVALDVTTLSTQYINTFDVLNGQIVAANFGAQESFQFIGINDNISTITPCCGLVSSFLSFNNNNDVTGHNLGFDSVNFTAVPEPSAFACLGLIGLIAGGRRWWKRRR